MITNYFHLNLTSLGRGLVMRVIKYQELAPVLSLWFVLVSNCAVSVLCPLYWPDRDRRALPDVIVMCRGKKQMSAAATVRLKRQLTPDHQTVNVCRVCLPARLDSCS